MDHNLPWGDSPVDLADVPPVGADEAVPARNRSGVGWACGAVIASSFALVAFNSHALANWADQIPVVPATAPIIALADDWHARAETMGLNAVVDRVGRAATAMRDAQWSWPQSGDGKNRPPTNAQR